MSARRDAETLWDVAVVLCFAAVTLLQGAPLLARFDVAIAADPGDPLLNTWILWWNTQQPPWSEAYWHAPAFAPAPFALALSETLLGLTIVTTPLQWLGASPLAAYNTLFLLTPILNGVSAYALCRVLTGRRDASFIGGLYFMMAPYRAAQVSHVQTLATFYMPLALLGVHAFWRTRRQGWLIVVLAATVANGVVSGYHLVYFALPLGLALVWMTAAREWRAAAAVAGTLGLSLLCLLPVLLPYQRIHQRWDLRRGFGEMTLFSADLSSFLAGAPALWWHPLPTLFPKPEADVYPGLACLGCLAIGTLLWRRAAAAGQTATSVSWVRGLRIGLVGIAVTAGLAAALSSLWGPMALEWGALRVSVTSLHKPMGAALTALLLWAASSPRLWASARRASLAGLYGTLFVVATILMLGPEGQVLGQPFWYKAPFAWLLELPGYDSVRVPARWATIQILAGAVLMALALASFRSLASRRTSTLLMLACSVGIVAEGWIVLPVVPVPSPLPTTLRADLVVELPTRGWVEDVAAMYRGTAHGRPVVNGYSGYYPPHYAWLGTDLQAGCLESLNALRRGRSLDVVVHTDDADGVRLLDAVRREWPGASETLASTLVVRHVPADRGRATSAYDEPIDLRGFCAAAREESPAEP